MGRRDVFVSPPILPKEKISCTPIARGIKNPSWIGRYLDQCGSLKERNSLLKETNER